MGIPRANRLRLSVKVFQATRQDTAGALKLPFAITVNPNEFPLPFGRIVITFGSEPQLADPFQVEEIR